MKKLIFGLIATLFLGFVGNAQKIGVLKDGKPTITEKMDFLKSAWERMLIEQKNPTKLVNFEISSEKFEEGGLVYYLIIASNESKTIKIAKQLVLNEEIFTIYNKIADASLEANTCTCSGCSDGCNPVLKSDGNFMCSACTEGGNNCTKTTTF